MEFLLLIPSLILALLLWRADRRLDEAEKAWRLERVGLLDRIQAPEQVLIQRTETPEPEHVPYDPGAWGPPPVTNGDPE